MKKTLIYMTGVLASLFVVICLNKPLKADWQYAYHPDDRYILGFELMLKDGDATEQDVFEAIAYYNHLTPQGVIQFVNRGNIPDYVDDLIEVGRLPEGFVVELIENPSPYDPYGTLEPETPSYENTPTTSEQENPPSNSEEPVTTPTEQPSETTPNEENSENNENTSEDNSDEKDETPNTSEEIKINNSAEGVYVSIEEFYSYEINDDRSSVVRYWYKDEHCQVNGVTDNGYYQVYKDYEVQYVKSSYLIPLEEYEAAWKELEKEESTCTEEGFITKENEITEKVKTESLSLKEHSLVPTEKKEPTCNKEGYVVKTCSVCDAVFTETLSTISHTEGKWVETTKSGLFSKGEKQLLCSECGEVLNTKETTPYIMYAVVIILICTGIAGAIIGARYYKTHKH